MGPYFVLGSAPWFEQHEEELYKVEIPLITTPSGTYTIYMGFWLGSQRIKVIEGPNDGVNRVRLGTFRVR